MAEDKSSFDVETIQKLVAMMSEHDVNELDLKQGETRLRLRRGFPVASAPAPAMVPAPVPTAAPASPSASAPAEEAPSDEKYVLIKSPGIGTYYAQEKPGADPYVSVGSRVQPDTVVCILEAMKTMHKLEAECSGTIVEVVAENAQAVEFGTVLFKVDPSQ